MRSPSKKQNPHAPDPMQGLNGVLKERNVAQTNTSPSRHIAAQQRPGFKKAPSEPLDYPTVKSNLNASKDQRTLQSAVEATMSSAPFGTIKKEQAIYSKQSTSAVPSREDLTQAVSNGAGAGAGPPAPIVASGSQTPQAIYQHIHEMASKRMSTLDYLRKAHEGRVHWFKTIHFSRTDLSRMPGFAAARLSRRATNYLLLGLSIPAVLDVHQQPNSTYTTPAAQASAIHEFLRSLYALLVEFESFQQIHPPDGSSTSSLSRARLPHMFKRATTGKGRRSISTAGAEIGLPMPQSVGVSTAPIQSGGVSGSSDYHHTHQPKPSVDTSVTSHSYSSSASTLVAASPSTSHPTPNTFPPNYSSFPASSPHDPHPNSILLPNEGPYMHLLTPPLPFAPDFYSVFATLCDVLIDAYQRVVALVTSPSVCTPAVAEVFTKADARLRKVIVGGVVKEFEGAARENARREFLSVQKVVLGGLMGG